MRFVDRGGSDEPPSLKTPSDAVKDEMAEAIAFYKTYNPLKPKTKGYGFKEYKGYDVTLRLSDLFHNKCAYCESDLGDNLDVEHFRPKGGVTGETSHSGYWWLAHTWSNLLPSCTSCNRKRRQHLVTEAMTPDELTGLMATKARVSHGKANQFPIAGERAFRKTDQLAKEKPDLIDPTVDDPAPYLRWSKAGHHSVVLAQPQDPTETRRALSTISVFALNRVRLVQSRTRILNELRYQAAEIIEELKKEKAGGGVANEHLDRALKRVKAMRRKHGPDQPYSAMVKAFVDEFAKQLPGMVQP
jgi:uncharacterized protein (TIGR02646 family)